MNPRKINSHYGGSAIMWVSPERLRAHIEKLKETNPKMEAIKEINEILNQPIRNQK
jgi:hypothetical protein